MNKAICPSLISNAVLVWSTIHIQRIVEELRSSGEVKDEDLTRVAPLLRMSERPCTTLSGTVEKIVKSPVLNFKQT